VITVVRYTREEYDVWNQLNAGARNGHFFFDRGFLEYHSDRFADYSLMLYENDRLLALLPANHKDRNVYSHQGLTFGGLVLHDKAATTHVLRAFDALLTHLRDCGFASLIYKPLPWIYHRRPAQEDLYALFRCNAQLTRRDVTTTICYAEPGQRSERRRRGKKKAEKAGLCFGESERWGDYWDMLSGLLSERHGVAPTHSLAEISMLAKRFPQQIKLFVAEDGPQLIAGVVVFEGNTVAHAQYIGANLRGRELGALDGLLDMLISRYSKHRYFNFGVSTENNGWDLNEGLIQQKEEFGGSAVVHDIYQVALQGVAHGDSA